MQVVDIIIIIIFLVIHFSSCFLPILLGLSLFSLLLQTRLILYFYLSPSLSFLFLLFIHPLSLFPPFPSLPHTMSLPPYHPSVSLYLFSHSFPFFSLSLLISFLSMLFLPPLSLHQYPYSLHLILVFQGSAIN